VESSNDDQSEAATKRPQRGAPRPPTRWGVFLPAGPEEEKPGALNRILRRPIVPNRDGWRAEARAAGIAADLDHLAVLRKYLIFDRKAGVSADSLIKAIDDYAEKLTGDRRALHAQHHSIGGSR
jgi:hypothetical protein